MSPKPQNYQSLITFVSGELDQIIGEKVVAINYRSMDDDSLDYGDIDVSFNKLTVTEQEFKSGQFIRILFQERSSKYNWLINPERTTKVPSSYRKIGTFNIKIGHANWSIDDAFQYRTIISNKLFLARLFVDDSDNETNSHDIAVINEHCAVVKNPVITSHEVNLIAAFKTICLFSPYVETSIHAKCLKGIAKYALKTTTVDPKQAIAMILSGKIESNINTIISLLLDPSIMFGDDSFMHIFALMYPRTNGNNQTRPYGLNLEEAFRCITKFMMVG